MKKWFKKLLIGASVSLMALIGLFATLIFYPNNLFAERITYKTVDLYAGSTVKGDYRSILDEAIGLVAISELYEKDYRYDIFLTNGTAYKPIIFRLTGPALARTLDNNIMLNVGVDFDKNLLFSTHNKRKLTQTIAHEMIHCLQAQRYGMLKFNPINHPPLWKLEGYPEYIAHQKEIRSTGYDFRATVRKLREYEENGSAWVELEPGYADPIVYFKGRVMVEYLMDVKGMRYDEMLNDKIREEAVYAELLDWHDRMSGVAVVIPGGPSGE